MVSSSSSNKKQESSRISGTYIRTLVKQLASSRTKDAHPAMTPHQDNSGDASVKSGKTQTQSQTQTHKKQVRRRLHTSRPYQERLLNMAEARREIVTALKQHRAAMRRASELRQRQQTQTQTRTQPQTQTLLLSEQESRPSLISAEYAVDPFSSCVHPPPPPQPPDPFPWPISTNPPLSFVLPNQPLGLNLNFQDFNDIIQTSPSSSSSICTTTNNNNPPIYSSPSSSSSPLEAVMTSPTPPSSAVSAAAGDAGFHQTVDEEEMARMRSIGENHQIEWNDTMNLVTSAWWFEFMKTVEPPPPEIKSEIDNDVFRPFDDVMEFPSWLNPTEDFDFFQPYLSDYSSPDDPALSW